MARQRGFTMIELLIAAAMMAIVVMYLMQTFTVQHRAYTVVDQVSEAQQSARAVSALMERDIRAAGMMVPERASVCGLDSSTGPDVLYVSAGEVIDPSGVDRPDVASTSPFASGNNFVSGGSQTFAVQKVDSSGSTSASVELADGDGPYYDTDGDGTNDADYVLNGGVILTDLANDRGTACGVITAISAGSNTMTVTWEGTLSATAPLTPIYRMVPAHRYAVDASTQTLTRDGLVLSTGVEDLQVAYDFDKNNDGNDSDPGEWRGTGTTAGATGNDYASADHDASEARKVRLNLVVRTKDQDPNRSFQGGQFQALENRAASATPDGFRRRVHRSEVRLRNVGTRDL